MWWACCKTIYIKPLRSAFWCALMYVCACVCGISFMSQVVKINVNLIHVQWHLLCCTVHCAMCVRACVRLYHKNAFVVTKKYYITWIAPVNEMTKRISHSTCIQQMTATINDNNNDIIKTIVKYSYWRSNQKKNVNAIASI